MILIRRIIAKNVHVKTRTLLNHRKADPPGSNHGDGFARDFIAKERQEWMPRRPPLFAHQPLALPHLSRQHAHHEKRELSRRFGEHIGCVGKRNFVFVRCCAIDVVEADRDLRHNLQRPLPSFEDFRINRIAQCGDQSVNTAFHLIDDQFLRRRLWSLKHFDVVTAGAKKILRRIANARCGKHAKMLFLRHSSKDLIRNSGMGSEGVSK